MQIPLPAIALGISMKSISKYPSQRPVFHPKIMPFLCPENTPQKCKWLQCVRLVINKRRPSADVAADAATSPARFARGRRPSAHTFTNKSPLNRSNLIAQKHQNPETRLRDEKRGGERSRPRWPARDRLPLFPAAYAFFLRAYRVTDSLRHITLPFSSFVAYPSDFCFFRVGYGSIVPRGRQRSQNHC